MEVHHNDEVTDLSSTSHAIDEFKAKFEDWAKESIPISKSFLVSNQYIDLRF
jgi:hypothetical protein